VEIAGKVAIVTGAASGIGRASAVALAARDVDEAGGKETVALIEADGGRASFVAVDLSRREEVFELFARTAEAYGGVDIVHNNAGIVSGEPEWPNMTPDRMALMMAVNLGAVVYGTHCAVAAMTERGGGVVINTASVEAIAPMPMDPIYSATKAAVMRFSESCRGLADSHGVRVNAILPAGVRTPILNKTGDGTRPAAWLAPILESGAMPLLEPEDIAAEVVAIVEDDSRVGEAKVLSPVPIEAFQQIGQ
jgi:NAD(P)-dependent dehydrogenase (short-subunit alcohol dehydrogenase family)